MIFVTSCRPMGDSPEYDSNQFRAYQSWLHVADAIVFFNDPQPLSSPITRYLPSEPYPRLIEMVDFCADQPDWCCLINSDIVVTPHFRRVEAKLKRIKATCASSWRWQFDPKVGIEPCHHVDNGLDFFAATPGAWGEIYETMHSTPQGEHDAAKHLRWGSPSWDSWMLGTFWKKFTSAFYNITGSKCIRHPLHGGRKHGGGVPDVHLEGWPVMSTAEITG